MTEKMSSAFYGNKKFMKYHHEEYAAKKNITDEEVRSIFAPYSEYLATVSSEDGQCTLLSLFAEFIRENLRRFQHLSFEKLASWIEISAHVFEYSFENHLTKKESYEYFTDVAVRHSLFRPPHSVNIFSYDELKEIMDFWIDTFCRCYAEYSECFMTEENRMLVGKISGFSPEDNKLKGAKQVSREEISRMVDFVNPKQEEPKEEQA